MHLVRPQCSSLAPKPSACFGLDNFYRMVTSSINFFHSSICVCVHLLQMIRGVSVAVMPYVLT